MRKIHFILFALSFSLDVVAQIRDSSNVLLQDNRSVDIRQINMHQNTGNQTVNGSSNLFNHLDASVTLGTTGIGIDLSSPVTNWAHLRLGYSFMPHFHYDMNFGIQVGDTQESKYDANGNRVVTKFDRLAEMLEGLTGYKVDDEVMVEGRPTYHNLKFLVDVFPFQNNKHWHVTAGFFWGPSKVADARNKMEEMPSLLAVGIYNRLYENTIRSYESVIRYENGEIEIWDIEPIVSLGPIEINGPSAIKSAYKSMISNGRMGMVLGKRVSDGSNYMMEPDENGMVRVEGRVNSFKPYLGVGYGGRLLKNSDKLHIAVDLGAMYWGQPSLITHDGTDMIKDIQKNTINGKPGDYVKMARHFPVFPVLDVRLVYSLF